MTALIPSARTLAALGLVGALSACGGSSGGLAVRNGPQALHPSPSSLAQGGIASATGSVQTVQGCEEPDTAPCYATSYAPLETATPYAAAAPYGNDGSAPIID